MRMSYFIILLAEGPGVASEIKNKKKFKIKILELFVLYVTVDLVRNSKNSIKETLQRETQYNKPD